MTELTVCFRVMCGLALTPKALGPVLSFKCNNLQYDYNMINPLTSKDPIL